MWHWLAHVTGSDNMQGSWYGFWSGFGSDIGEVVLIGGLIGLCRKHVCHEHRCWRLGRHPVNGTPFTACRKHHPDIDHTKPIRLTNHADS